MHKAFLVLASILFLVFGCSHGKVADVGDPTARQMGNFNHLVPSKVQTLGHMQIDENGWDTDGDGVKETTATAYCNSEFTVPGSCVELGDKVICREECNFGVVKLEYDAKIYGWVHFDNSDPSSRKNFIIISTRCNGYFDEFAPAHFVDGNLRTKARSPARAPCP